MTRRKGGWVVEADQGFSERERERKWILELPTKQKRKDPGSPCSVFADAARWRAHLRGMCEVAAGDLLNSPPDCRVNIQERSVGSARVHAVSGGPGRMTPQPPACHIELRLCSSAFQQPPHRDPGTNQAVFLPCSSLLPCLFERDTPHPTKRGCIEKKKRKIEPR